MTTKNSPLAKLQRQADQIASMLKCLLASPGQWAEAKARGYVKFAICMDDKTIVVEMPCSAIEETDEAGIARWIVDWMQERKDKLDG